MLSREKIKDIVSLSLEEDVGDGDITAALLDDSIIGHANIVCQQDAVICGIDFVLEVFSQLSSQIEIHWNVKDGDFVHSNQIICSLKGPIYSLLAGERCALNFLQTLSSTATLTKQFVDRIQDTNAKLLDTRKTLPGLRFAQKYAVLCGGGCNHRFGLYDAILIKENHIKAYGSIAGIVKMAKKIHPDKLIEVEVTNMDEFEEALSTDVDVVMLDNFELDDIYEAVKRCKVGVRIEVSGGVNLDNVYEIAKSGVDYISVGFITKTVVPIELSMIVEELL